MSRAKLFLAPAAAGKTAYVLSMVREAASGLTMTPWVVVPTQLQVRSWRRRLAERGGAIGVRVATFDELYRTCLNAACEVYTELSEANQYHLLQAVVNTLRLQHYAPLAGRPGLIRLLLQLIAEFKAGMIYPEALAEGVAALGNPPRLAELVQVYAAYQTRLQGGHWADGAGLGWLAVAALEQKAADLGRDWALLVVDGFDNLTPVQLTVLRILGGRVGSMIVTLTGQTNSREERLVHRRFQETRRRLEAALDVQAEPLPQVSCAHAVPLVHLERGLFSGGAGVIDGSGCVEMVAAPGRNDEVRAALRWLKARLIVDGMQPWEVALLARGLEPYQEAIQQVAGEFQLPVRLMDGRPLRSSPAVAALVRLLQLMLPRSTENNEFALPRRATVEAWRSPYFDWSPKLDSGTTEAFEIKPEDADVLDAVARWGRVVAGLAQWEEVLDDLVQLTAERESEDEERGWPPGLPRGQEAVALRSKFQRFVGLLEPPAGVHTMQRFVAWLEDLIGTEGDEGEMALWGESRGPGDGSAGLRMVSRINQGAKESAENDLAALAALKRVLHGLVWAEEVLVSRPTDYAGFYRELTAAVETNTFHLLPDPKHEEVLAGDVLQARGVPLRAVAIVGLAEGEFPSRLREDPLLRDADRKQLRRDPRLPMELSVESAEAEFFYEAITGGRERILLTRPRLDDTGALWQPSPFWEEVVRLVNVVPVTLPSENAPRVDYAASWPEFVEGMVTDSGNETAWRWMSQEQPMRLAAMEHAAEVFRCRRRQEPGSAYDGELSVLMSDLTDAHGPGSNWSASRLESYRACPFQFFVRNLLELEPRDEPMEGLDARQLGNIYHRILERVYQAPEVDDRTDCDQLLAALERVADRVLDEAPAREGFRETAWWEQTRMEIVQNLRRSLEALSALPDDLIPVQYEVAFGSRGVPPLVVRDGDDSFSLRGLIDRIDRSADGRLRLIDYKTSHPAGFDNRAVSEGKKLQLPLYALAARDALRLGDPVEGFYWHVRHAEPSRFTLSEFPGGPEHAFKIAVEKAWEAIGGVRRGLFRPHPPDGGCPSYCPASGFCWHLELGWGGGG